MKTQAQQNTAIDQRAQAESALAMLMDAMEATPECMAPLAMAEAAKKLGWSDGTCERISNLFGRLPQDRLRMGWPNG